MPLFRRLIAAASLAIAGSASIAGDLAAAPGICRTIFGQAAGYSDAASSSEELRSFYVSRLCQSYYLGSGGDTREAQFLHDYLTETGRDRGSSLDAFAQNVCQDFFASRRTDHRPSPPIERLGGDALEAWKSCRTLQGRGYDVDVTLSGTNDLRVTVEAPDRRVIGIGTVTSVPRGAVSCQPVDQWRSRSRATFDCTRTPGPSNRRHGPLRAADYAYAVLEIDSQPLMILFPHESAEIPERRPGGRPEPRPRPAPGFSIDIIASHNVHLPKNVGSRCANRRQTLAPDDGRTFCAITGMVGSFQGFEEKAEIRQSDGNWELSVRGCRDRIGVTATCFRVRN